MCWHSAQLCLHFYFLGGNNPEEDLALLASCHHTLLGYGTFGLWGGVLAGGEVVGPDSLKLFRGTASLAAAQYWNWTLLPGFWKRRFLKVHNPFIIDYIEYFVLSLWYKLNIKWLIFGVVLTIMVTFIYGIVCIFEIVVHWARSLMVNQIHTITKVLTLSPQLESM